MAMSEIKSAVSDRFGLLMQAAAYRLSVNNPEMWEHCTDVVPWTVLDSLSVLPDDTEAAGWLLHEARPQEIMCIVMGHAKLVAKAGKGNEKADLYMREAMQATTLGKAFRVFALYWLNLPLDYRHKTEAAVPGAVTQDELAGLSGVL